MSPQMYVKPLRDQAPAQAAEKPHSPNCCRIPALNWLVVGMPEPLLMRKASGLGPLPLAMMLLRPACVRYASFHLIVCWPSLRGCPSDENWKFSTWYWRR